MEAILEVFKVAQLESLILPWVGVAHWPSQQQNHVEAFDRAGSFFFLRPLSDVAGHHQELLLFGLLEVGIEHARADATLAGVACAATG